MAINGIEAWYLENTGSDRQLHVLHQFCVNLAVCRKRVEPDFEGFQAPPDKAPHFVFPLRDRFIQEGVGFKLLASVEGKPPPTVNSIARVHVVIVNEISVPMQLAQCWFPGLVISSAKI